jgi:hypothetical protein
MNELRDALQRIGAPLTAQLWMLTTYERLLPWKANWELNIGLVYSNVVGLTLRCGLDSIYHYIKKSGDRYDVHAYVDLAYDNTGVADWSWLGLRIIRGSPPDRFTATVTRIEDLPSLIELYTILLGPEQRLIV